MNNIKIALTNLGKYNEGELVYKWLDLPYAENELSEALEEIGINGQYEEYFISDYESPFPINEYENISNLNELAEMLEGVNIPEKHKYIGYDTNEVINFINELENNGLINDKYLYIGNIVDSDEIDEMIKDKLEDGKSWERIKFFLEDAENDAQFNRLDGYGNLVKIDQSDLNIIVSEAFEEVNNNL